MDVLPNGNLLIPDMQQHRVVEYDADGKQLKAINVQWPTSASRLPNGHTLVTSQTTRRLIEFNREGQVALAKRNGPRYTGRYHASDDAVQIDYKVGNQSVITTLTPSLDKRELYARSAVTGMNAVYEKRP
jgi:hypothetical protein